MKLELEEKVNILSRTIDRESELRGSNVEKILERIVDLELRQSSESMILNSVANRVAEFDPPGTSIHARVRALELLLEGDKHLRAEWEKQHKLGVTPNIPEPPEGGALFAIDRTFGSLRSSIEALGAKLDARIRETQQHMNFIAKLEQFFGPMLRDKTPPIDGQQIADKAYVDASVARSSGALRSEFTAAVAFVSQLLKDFSGASGDRIGDTVSVQIMRATSKIVALWVEQTKREKSEAQAKPPGRLQMLLWVISGKPATEFMS